MAPLAPFVAGLAAGLLATTTACGTEASPPDVADSGSGKADGDADAPDAGAGDIDPSPVVDQVKVVVYAEEGVTWYDPSGYRVAFFDPAGAFLTMVETDAEGVALAAVPAGSTLVLLDEPNWDIEHYNAVLGVEPGDVIRYMYRDPNDWTGYRDMSASLPALAGAEEYSVISACGGARGATTALTFRFQPACAGQTVPVLATAGSQYSWQLFASQRGTATLTEGGTVALTGEWVATEPFTLAVGNGSTEFEDVRTSVFPLIADRGLYLLEVAPDDDIAAPGETVSASVDVPDSSQVDGRVARLHRGHGIYHQSEILVVPPDADSVLFDEAADPLPYFRRGSFDFATRRLAFERSAGAELDAVWVDFKLAACDDCDAARWNILVPPDTTSFTLPRISDATGYPGLDEEPDEVHDWVISESGYQSTAIDGYRGARNDVGYAPWAYDHRPMPVGTRFRTTSVESHTVGFD